MRTSEDGAGGRTGDQAVVRSAPDAAEPERVDEPADPEEDTAESALEEAGYGYGV